MKILHTSDWHLGRTLYSKKDRQEEHTAFLEWLLQTIKEHSIDLLLVAGDVFDTASPSSTSQLMYYNFLVKAIHSGCKQVIVVGGNHDSPSFLNAPKKVLSALNVVVVGNTSENLEEEVIVVKDAQHRPSLIVCAVPFLRPRDIGRFVEAETYSERSKRINESIRAHYKTVAEIAAQKREELGETIPIIATGHLSIVGGKRNEDDGVRETYVGGVEALESDIFPDIFDYVALGHYHIPSKIKEHIRYCGSPIPMGFKEAEQKKCVYVIDFSDGQRNIQTIEIPQFQKLKSIVGDKKYIEQTLSELKKENASVWVEIIYEGNEIFPELSSWINEKIENSSIEVLNLQNNQQLKQALNSQDTNFSLDKLSVFDVFDKLLDKAGIAEEQKQELRASYKEIIDELNIPE
ncbi:MAG: exonuclease SbcCD subunit D C-terminal domain-containing protein [Raineya sp.]